MTWIKIGCFITISIEFGLAQSHFIKGHVYDYESHEPIPFVSVYLKQSLSGTNSNKEGLFTLDTRNTSKTDTLLFHALGYSEKKYSITDSIPEKIHLKKDIFNLQEVVLVYQTPIAYIKNATKKFKENYPSDPFITYGNYKIKLLENANTVLGSKSKIKSYHANYHKPNNNHHQILSYESVENLSELDFFSKQITRINKKKDRKNRRMKESTENTEAISIFNIENPDLFFEYDPITKKQSVINELFFDRYRYAFDERCNERNLTVISFESKKDIYNSKRVGTLFFDCENDALIRLEIKITPKIKLHYQALLWVTGYKIHKGGEAYYKIEYKQHKDKLWYPFLYFSEGRGIIEKRRLFSSNSKSEFDFEHYLIIDKVKTKNISTIPEIKRYNKKQPMKTQIHNIE